MTHKDFYTIIDSKQPIHISGIGGVSMRALARLLKSMGANVRGSDRERSLYTEQLCAEGIPVVIGHFSSNTDGASVVIRTAAIPNDNAEIANALDLGIPVLERTQAWGILMHRYKNAVCIAGTHGKTSTTSMIATFAQAGALDPTVMVGGDLPSIGGTLKIGGDDLIIAEACEYKNSFLNLTPSVAVILNIDRDHLDFFSDTDDIIASFRRFALLTPEHGSIVVNGDDVNTTRATAGIERNIITFGSSSNSDVYPDNITITRGFYSCDIMHRGTFYARMELNVPGLHNLTNGLASAAVAIVLGMSGEDFARGISQYKGVGRRFEFKKNWRGAMVFDDYAHHPSEISASLQAAHAMNAGRVICVFQPHTYTRTASLLHEFAMALSGADVCLLCPIFAAREVNTIGITSQSLAALIPDGESMPSFDDVATRLAQIVQPNDLILTMGAGDVYKISDLLHD